MFPEPPTIRPDDVRHLLRIGHVGVSSLAEFSKLLPDPITLIIEHALGFVQKLHDVLLGVVPSPDLFVVKTIR